MRRPQNNSTLAENVSTVIQEAGKLNRLMAEGKFYELAESVGMMKRSLTVAEYHIIDILGLDG